MIWLILWFSLVTYYFITASINVYSTICGYRAMKDIQNNPSLGIRLESQMYSRKTNYIQLGWALLASILCPIAFMYSLKSPLFLSYSVSFPVMWMISLSELVIFGLSYKYGAESYLYYGGLATVNYDYRVNQCTFSVDTESHGDENMDFINVYKKKSKIACRFKIIERPDEVKMMVSRF